MSGDTRPEDETAHRSRPREGTDGDGARNTGPALEAHYRFLLWLVPAVERFPRSQKFLLGDRIQGAALDVLESLIEATYTRRRSSCLARANLGIEKLRFFFRLAQDFRSLPAGPLQDHRGIRPEAPRGPGRALPRPGGAEGGPG